MDHPFQDLYDQIPKMDCKGFCGSDRHNTCCGPIIATAIEARLLDQYDGIRSPWEVSDKVPGALKMIPASIKDFFCPHLTANGRCGAYEVRPMICRLWGAIPRLPCPWGCKPQQMMTDKRAFELLKEAEQRSMKEARDLME